MPAVATRTPCADHRRREARAACVVCTSPVCAACIVPTPVGFKCRRCSGVAPPRGGGGRPRWAVPAVALGLLAVAVAGYGLVPGDQADPPDRRREDVVADPVGERRVQFPGAGGVTIGATLAAPSSAVAGPVPGVLVVAGFGPADREGVASSGGVADPLYRDLSQALAGAGMASLRYDKRGTGQSVLPPDQRLSFDDLVADARAGLTFLGERREVDPAALAVVGHEEGGLVAMRLAAADPRVKALVLVSTPGRPLVEVLSDDFRNTHGQAAADGFRAVVAGLLRTGTLPAPEGLPPEHRDFFPAGEVEYLKQIFSLDPSAEAAQVGVPALVVRGALAAGVSASDSDRLAQALGPKAEVVVGPGVGHTLAVPGSAPSAGGDTSHDHSGSGAAVGPPQRDRDLLARISGWLAGRLRR